MHIKFDQLTCLQSATIHVPQGCGCGANMTLTPAPDLRGVTRNSITTTLAYACGVLLRLSTLDYRAHLVSGFHTKQSVEKIICSRFQS